MNGKKATIYISVVSLVLLILILSMTSPMVTNSADFSIYNRGWNGCSRLAVRTYESGRFTPNLALDTGEELGVANRDLSSYDIEPEKTTIVILGPSTNFNSRDITYIHNFLQQGGILLLGDDFGSGNTLLDGLEGTRSRFIQTPVLDLSFEKKPHFAVAYDIEEHQLTQGVEHLLLNKPATMSADENATILVHTSRASWLDRNDNGIWDKGEPRGSFPILSLESYGDGKLILLSDPSILINSMHDKLDNSELINNLFVFISSDRENIIFDESHRDHNIIYNLVYTVSYPSGSIAYGVVTVALITSIFIAVPEQRDGFYRWVRVSLFKEKKEDGDPVRKLLNKYPHWNENKLVMVKKRFAVKRDD